MKSKDEHLLGITKDFLSTNYTYDTYGKLIKNGRRCGWDCKLYRRVEIKGKPFLEHRLIWIIHNGVIPEGYTVDHIDHNTFNNCITNLRLATRSEQNRYQRKRTNCSSKYIGVYFRKSSKKWEAYVNTYHKGVGKIHNYLGSFSSEEEAALIRDLYVIQHNLTKWVKLNNKKVDI